MLRTIPFGSVPFERGTVWLAADAAEWAGGVPYRFAVLAQSSRLTGVGVRSERTVPTAEAVPPRFIALRSLEPSASSGSYNVFLGVSVLPAEPRTLTIDVLTPEDAPPEYAQALLGAAVAETASWDHAATLRFDHAIWHPVDGKLRWFLRAARVLVALASLDGAHLADAALAQRALAKWTRPDLD
jgi:hypothetical protein